MTDKEFEFSISILVVDSDEASRRLLAETLYALGYRILQAQSVADAGNILSGNRIDLVMTDVFLPRGDGVKFMLKLKKEQPDIPVIILTTLLDNSARTELYESGADGILTKPFRINLVEELIAATLLKYDKAAQTAPRSRRKILVVDDDLNLLNFMSEALRTLGYGVEAKQTAAEALVAFSKRKFDLVISDYMLSDGDSIDLMRQVRKIRPKVSFVIVTGYPLAYPPALAKSDGVDGYLIKPFRINQLEQVIANILYPEKAKK